MGQFVLQVNNKNDDVQVEVPQCHEPLPRASTTAGSKARNRRQGSSSELIGPNAWSIGPASGLELSQYASFVHG